MNDEFRRMVRNLAKPGAEILTTMTADKLHMLHMLLGIAGESGEVRTAFRKSMNIMTDGRSTSETRQQIRADLIEELGDLEFYLEGFIQGFTDTYLNGERPEDECMTPPMYWDTFGAADDLMQRTTALVDDVKKALIYGKDMNERIINRIKNIRLSLKVLYQALDTNREEVMEANMQKLLKGENARYKEGSYSNEAAIARSDKAVN